jgi:DtxR family Mn-dependent transcriptional regulator
MSQVSEKKSPFLFQNFFPFSLLKTLLRKEEEDLLKNIYTKEEEGEKVFPIRPALFQWVKKWALHTLIKRGWVKQEEEGVTLTPQGRKEAERVVRAHRLWETYLHEQGGVSIEEIHPLAEEKEHSLSPHDLEILEARLNYPLTDPHGDPIPQEGREKKKGVPLSRFPLHTPGIITHIEDEPGGFLKKWKKLKIPLQTPFLILERKPSSFLLQTPYGEREVPNPYGEKIHGIPLGQPTLFTPPLTLDQVPEGVPVRIRNLSPTLKGLLRRRLLDLGFTPGTQVVPRFKSRFFGGDPTAYEIRSTRIALRKEIASKIEVEPIHEGKDTYGSSL